MESDEVMWPCSIRILLENRYHSNYKVSLFCIHNPNPKSNSSFRGRSTSLAVVSEWPLQAWSLKYQPEPPYQGKSLAQKHQNPKYQQTLSSFIYIVTTVVHTVSEKVHYWWVRNKKVIALIQDNLCLTQQKKHKSCIC